MTACSKVGLKFGLAYPPILLALGVGHSFATMLKSLFLPRSHSFLAPSTVRVPLSPSVALAVGNNPDAIPPVGCAKGGSGNTMPFRIIPDLKERPEYLIQSARAKGRDVFNECVFWLDLFDDPMELPPKAGSFS